MLQSKSPKIKLFRYAVVSLFAILALSATFSGFQTKQVNAAGNTSTLNFQARLLNAQGAIVPDGSYNVDFKLYNTASTGGQAQGTCSSACLWEETWTGANVITVKNGYLSAYLGSITSFPTTINWNQPLWLTMNIGGTGGSPSWDGEMTPRIQLTALPYAFTSSQMANYTGTYSQTLTFGASPTTNETIVLPDPGTATTQYVCYQGASGCGFLTGTGAGVDLQATTAGTPQTGNFNVTGTGIVSSLLTLNSSSDSLDTATAGGVLSLGNTNATSITLGANTTINANKSLIADGSTILADATSSATAFQVQNTAGLDLLTANSSNSSISTDALSAPGTISATIPPVIPTTAAFTGTAGTTSYSYEVVAADANGATTLASPQKTTAVTANAALGASNYVTLSYGAVTGASNYYIYRTATGGTAATGNGATTGLVGTSTTTSFIDYGYLASSPAPANSTTLAAATYWFKVTALDATGGQTTATETTAGTAVGANLGITVSWAPVTGAREYDVYYGTSSGAEANYFTAYTNSYLFTTTTGNTAGSPPTTNNAYNDTLSTTGNSQITLGNTAGSASSAQLDVAGSIPSAAVSKTTVGTNPKSVTVYGNYAYIVNGGSNNLVIYNVANPASPVQVGSISTGAGSSPIAVSVFGNYAYVVNNGNNTIGIYNVSNPSINCSTSCATATIATGGGTSPDAIYASGSYAYVVENGTNTVAVFNIANPLNPIEIATVSTGAGTSPDAVYVQGNYLYEVNYIGGTMEIFNVSNPYSPTAMGSVITGSGGLPDSVYVSGTYAYVSNGNTNSLAIVNVSNAMTPALVDTLPTGSAPQQVFVQGHYVYLTDDGAGTITTYDVTNPASPLLVGTITTGGQPFALYVQGRYLYEVNYTAGTLQVYDLGGAYIQQLQAGGAEVGSLQVDNDASITGNETLQGGITIGGAAQVGNSLAVAGTTQLTGATSVIGGILGGFQVNGLTTPAAPVVTFKGTTGTAATWSYKIVAVSPGGTTPASAVGSISASDNATLSSSNYNIITWTAVTGATSYNVYRTAVGTSPTTTGLIASTTATVYNDIGGAGDSTTAPAVDTSDQEILGNTTTNSGAIVFDDGVNTNTITLGTGTTTSSYSLQLPTTAPSATLCLESGPSGTTSQLQFTSCVNTNPNISFVSESDEHSDASATTQTGPTFSAATAGDLEVVMVQIPTAGVSVSSISGGGVTTWTKAAANSAVVGSSNRIEMWFGSVTTASSGTPSVTYSAAPGANTEIAVSEYTAIGVTAGTTWGSAVSGTLFNTPASTTLTYPSLTSSTNGQLYLGYAVDNGVGDSSCTHYTCSTTGQSNVIDYNVSENVSTSYQGIAAITSNLSNAIAVSFIAFINSTAINNSVSTQNANFNVQASTAGTVAGVIQANASGSADILDLKSGTGTIVDSFGSSGNLAVGGSLTVAGGLLGGVITSTLSTPSAPTVQCESTGSGCSGGATSYSYEIIAVGDGTGITPLSAAGSTSTSASSLSATTYNQITWTAVTGAASYQIYRTVGGTAQGLIGTATTNTFNDTGLTATGAPAVAFTGTIGTSTTYTYTVLALGSTSNTYISYYSGSITSGDTTFANFNGSNYNTITWPTVAGATGYQVYRVTGGTSQGLIDSTTSNSFSDVGIAANGSIPVTASVGNSGSVGVNGSLVLGNTTNVDGSIAFDNGTNANAVTLSESTAGAGYNLTLPTVAPAVGLCLETSTSNSTALVFNSCANTNPSITYVTASENDENSDANTQAELSNTYTPSAKGDLEILMTSITNSGVTVSHVTGGDVTSWTLAEGSNGGTGDSNRVEIWFGTVTSTAAGTQATVTYSSVGGPGAATEIATSEFTAVGVSQSTSWGVDTAGASFNTPASTTLSFPSLVSSTTGELYLGYGNDDANGMGTCQNTPAYSCIQTTTSTQHNTINYNPTTVVATPYQGLDTITNSLSNAAGVLFEAFLDSTAINNSVSTQEANFDVQAANSGSVAGVLQANASGNADILDLLNGTGTKEFTVSNTGLTTIGDSSTITFVQEQDAHAASTGTSTLTSFTPTHVGDLLTLGVECASTTATVAQVTGGDVSNWYAVTNNTSTQSYSAAYQGTVTSTTASVSINVTYSASPAATCELVVDEYSSGAGSSTVWSVTSDTNQIGANNTAVTMPSLTATEYGELYWSYAALKYTPTNPSNQAPYVYHVTGASNEVVYDNATSSGTSYSPSFTQATASTSSQVALMISAAGDPTTINAVQEVDAHGTSEASLGITPHALGDLITLGIGCAGTTGNVTNVTGGGVNSWIRVNSNTNGATSKSTMYEGTVSSTAAGTIAVTYSSAPGVTCELAAQEFAAASGSSTSWTVSSSLGQAGTASTTVTMPSLTQTQYNELYWGYAQLQSTPTAGTSAGFSYVATGNNNEIVYDPTTSSTSALAPTFTQSAADTNSQVGAMISASTVSNLTDNGGAIFTGSSAQSDVQVQNASGSVVLNADTLNDRVSVDAGFTSLSVPSITAVTPATTGGALGSASGDYTYCYEVTAIDGSDNQTTPSTESCAATTSATATNTMTLTWGAVTGSSGYRIYRTQDDNTGATQGLNYTATGTSFATPSLTYSGLSATTAFTVGQYVYVTGCVQAADNGTFQVTSTTASTVVVTDSGGSATSSTGCVVPSTKSGSETYVGAATSNTFVDKGQFTPTAINPPSINAAYSSSSTTNNNLQLVVGGNGTPTGQVYISGTVPSSFIGTYPVTGGTPYGIATQGNYAYVSFATTDTMSVFDVSNPSNPVLLGSATTLGTPEYLQVAGKYVYIADATNPGYLQIYDVSNPYNPVLVSTFATAGNSATAVYVVGNYAYITDSASTTNNFEIVNIANPYSPSEVSAITAGSAPFNDYVSGHYAYILSGSNLISVDVSNPANPVVDQTYSTPGGLNLQNEYVQGSFDYIDAGSATYGDLITVNIANPYAMTATPAGSYNLDTTANCGSNTGNNADGIYVEGRYAYSVSYTAAYMQVIDISNPYNPVCVGSVSTGTGTSPENVWASGRYVYVDNGTGTTMDIFDVGGEYTSALQSGALETGTLSVDTNGLINGYLGVAGGLQVGGSTDIAGAFEDNGGSSLLGNVLVGATVSVPVPPAPTVTATCASTCTSIYEYGDSVTDSAGGVTVENTQTSVDNNSALSNSTGPDYNTVTIAADTTSALSITSYNVYRCAGGTTTTPTYTCGTNTNNKLVATIATTSTAVVHPTTTTYASSALTYSGLSNPTEVQYQTVTVTGCSSAGDNGTFVVTSVTAATIVVYDAAGVAAATGCNVTGNLAVRDYGAAGGAAAPLTGTNENSATAFQVQNASNANILAVNTIAGSVAFGNTTANAAQLVLNDGINANTVTLTTGTTGSSYNLVLPTSGASASGQCLESTSSGTTTALGFSTCASTTYTISYIREADFHSSTVNATTYTNSVTTSNLGDLLIVSANINSASFTVSNVSGGGASNWHVINSFTPTGHSIAIWVGTVTSTGTANLTVTYSGNITTNTAEVVAAEYSAGAGLGTVWTVDATNTISNAASTTINYPSVTAPQANELYFGYAVGTGATVTTGCTVNFTCKNTALPSDYIYDTSSAIGALAPSVTGSSSAVSYAISMVVRATESGFINNGTATQTGNLNVQAATSGSVAGTFQANAAGTADILDLDNGTGTIVDSYSSTGLENIGSSSAITSVGEWDTAGSNKASLTVTPHAIGNIMVLAIEMDAAKTGNLSVASVSGGGVSNWTKVVVNNVYYTPQRQELWEGTILSTAATNITVTYSSLTATNEELVAQEFTAGLGSNTDWTVTTTGTDDNGSASSTATYPSLVPTESNELYWGYNVSGYATTSGGAGFTYGVTGADANPYAYTTSTVRGTTYTPTDALSTSTYSYGAAMMVSASLGTGLNVYGGSSTIDSTTTTSAFTVNDAAGGSILNVDTQNDRVNIADTLTPLGIPYISTASTATTGGTLAQNTTYYYEVTAANGDGGETSFSNQYAETTGNTTATNTITLTFNPIPGATAYHIYRSTTSSSYTGVGYYSTIGTVSGTNVTFTDTNATKNNTTASPPNTSSAYTATANNDQASNNNQLAIGGDNGSVTGQLYVAGSVPASAVGSISTGSGTNPYAVAVSGSYAYEVNPSTSTLSVYDISNPDNPVLVNTISTGPGGDPTSISVDGAYAYVGMGTADYVAVYSISNPNSPYYGGYVATSGTVNAVYASGTNLYILAISGTTSSLTIWGLANPIFPNYISYTNAGPSATNFAIQSGYAYIAETGSDLIQLINVSNAVFPVVAGSITTGSYAPTNVVVEGTYAYVTLGTSASYIGIYDIANPASPALVDTYSTGDNYSTDLSISGRYLYVTSENTSSIGLLSTYDVSDPATPLSVGSTTIGADSTPPAFAIQGRYAYVLDSSAATLQTFDMGGAYIQQVQAGNTETTSLQVDATANVGGDENITGGLSVGGGTQLYGNVGITGALTVGTSSLVVIGANSDYNTEDPYNVYVQGNYAYVASTGTNSLTVYDTVSSVPVFVGGSSSHLSGPTGVYVQGNYAYVASNGNNELVIFNISSGIPVYTGEIGTNLDGPYNLWVQGNDAYVISSINSKLVSYNVSNPTDPTYIGMNSDTYLSNPYWFSIQGDYAYVSSNNNSNLVDYNISSGIPVYVGETSTDLNYPADVVVQGNYAYVDNDGSDNITTIDISNPASPTTVGYAGTGFLNDPQGMAVQGNTLYVTSVTNDEIITYNIAQSTPVETAQVSTYLLNGPAAIAVQGNYAIVVNSTDSPGPDSVLSYYIGGTYIQQVQSGGTQTGTLDVQSNANVGGDDNIAGGLTVGGATVLNGSVGFGGQVTIANQTNSTVTLQVQNASGNNIIDVNTSNGIVNIGEGAAQTSAVVTFATPAITYTGLTSNPISAGTVTVTGCTSAADNGTFTVISGTSTTLTVSNSSGVAIGSAANCTIGDGTGYLIALDNKITTGDPTEVNGAMYYSAYNGTFRCGVAGAWQDCAVGFGYANTATGTTITGATTGLQSLGSTGSMPANFCTAGKIITITANGIYSTTTTAQPMTFVIRVGGTSIGVTSTAFTPAVSITNAAWTLSYQIICDAAPSASSAVNGQGYIRLYPVASTNIATNGAALEEIPLFTTSFTTTNVNTSTADAINIGVTYTGTASASNKISFNQFIVQAQ
jgi:hypothetical protein